MKVNTDLTCYFNNYEIILMLQYLDQLVQNKDISLENIDKEEEMEDFKILILTRITKFYKMLFEDIRDIIDIQ